MQHLFSSWSAKAFAVAGRRALSIRWFPLISHYWLTVRTKSSPVIIMMLLLFPLFVVVVVSLSIRCASDEHGALLRLRLWRVFYLFCSIQACHCGSQSKPMPIASASASTQLSGSTTEQASALQETVSSLHEVSSMVNENAQNSQKSLMILFFKQSFCLLLLQ